MKALKFALGCESEGSYGRHSLLRTRRMRELDKDSGGLALPRSAISRSVHFTVTDCVGASALLDRLLAANCPKLADPSPRPTNVVHDHRLPSRVAATSDDRFGLANGTMMANINTSDGVFVGATIRRRGAVARQSGQGCAHRKGGTGLMSIPSTTRAHFTTRGLPSPLLVPGPYISCRYSRSGYDLPYVN